MEASGRRGERRKLFVVACIPAFNEERTIAKVVLKAMKYVDRVIVCDDGSSDLTGEIAEKLGAEVIRHERNFGKGAALKSLFKRAIELNADIIVTLDADGQHDPDEIPRLLEPIVSGKANAVVGSRYVEGARLEAPLYRRVGLKVLNLIFKKTSKGNAVRDTQSGFRAFTLEALEKIGSFESKGYGVESEMLVLAFRRGLRVVEVPVTVRYRGVEGRSKKNPFSHGSEILGTLIKMVVEERPLLYLGLPGAFFLAVSAMLGAYMLWLFNATRYFSIPIALVTLGTALLGIVLVIAALILYALIKLFEKIKK